MELFLRLLNNLLLLIEHHPRAFSSLCEHKGLLYFWHWWPMYVGPIPHEPELQSQAVVPWLLQKNSSAPENFGVPPQSGVRQACDLAWLMAKNVFTNIHCGCVITGGEQKLITSDYSTCECICGSGIKSVSALGEENIATLIKFSILFSLSLSGLPVWSSLLVWESKQTFQIILQYDVASKYYPKYLGITTAASMQLTSLDWDSAYNKKLPAEVRDLWNFPQEVKAASISSINFLFIHQSIFRSLDIQLLWQYTCLNLHLFHNLFYFWSMGN